MPSSMIPSLWQNPLGLPDEPPLYDNQGRIGITVTSSATAHVKGAWTDVLTVPTTHPTYGIVVEVLGVASSATASAMLVDIGFGPTGGEVDAITTGDFASDANWTKGSNWQIGSGVADQSTPTASDLSQTPSPALIQGEVYDVTYTIASRTAGAIVVKIGGTSGTSRSTNETFRETIIAGSGTLIEFTADGTWDGNIDNVILVVSIHVVLPNLNTWGAPGTADPGGCVYNFPGVYIPAGVEVSARNQCVIVSRNSQICVWLGQNAPTPYIAGQVVDYGTVLASSSGTLVTPGNDAFGTYIEIGTTDRDHTMWTFGMDGQTETLFTGNQNVHVIEIGFGPDNSNVTRIGSRWRVPFGTSEEIASTIPPYAYAVVPRGTKLWCRIAGGDADVDPRGIIIYGWD